MKKKLKKTEVMNENNTLNEEMVLAPETDMGMAGETLETTVEEIPTEEGFSEAVLSEEVDSEEVLAEEVLAEEVLAEEVIPEDNENRIRRRHKYLDATVDPEAQPLYQ